MHFLRDCLSKRKQLLKASDIVKINIPAYEELSVKNLWSKFKDSSPLCDYIPEYSNPDDYLDRDFFYSVICSVYPHYISKITQDALRLRHSEKASADD